MFPNILSSSNHLHATIASEKSPASAATSPRTVTTANQLIFQHDNHPLVDSRNQRHPFHHANKSPNHHQTVPENRNQSEPDQMLISDVKQDHRRIHALPRTHVYLDITAIMEVLTCLVSSPKKKKLESKLSNSPWGYMKGTQI